MDTAHDGRVKLYVTATALRARRENPGLFTTGDYAPLSASGARGDHAFAFARRHSNRAAVAVAPRLRAKLTAAGGWGDTRLPLPPGTFRDAFTSRPFAGEVPLADLLADFPVALLIGDARA
jgi:(1->4)-alpha-D-glucan 1-alpha-D-glucosylmutase